MMLPAMFRSMSAASLGSITALVLGVANQADLDGRCQGQVPVGALQPISHTGPNNQTQPLVVRTCSTRLPINIRRVVEARQQVILVFAILQPAATHRGVTSNHCLLQCQSMMYGTDRMCVLWCSARIWHRSNVCFVVQCEDKDSAGATIAAATGTAATGTTATGTARGVSGSAHLGRAAATGPPVWFLLLYPLGLGMAVPSGHGF